MSDDALDGGFWRNLSGLARDWVTRTHQRVADRLPMYGPYIERPADWVLVLAVVGVAAVALYVYTAAPIYTFSAIGDYLGASNPSKFGIGLYALVTIWVLMKVRG